MFPREEWWEWEGRLKSFRPIALPMATVNFNFGDFSGLDVRERSLVIYFPSEKV